MFTKTAQAVPAFRKHGTSMIVEIIFCNKTSFLLETHQDTVVPLKTYNIKDLPYECQSNYLDKHIGWSHALMFLSILHSITSNFNMLT